MRAHVDPAVLLWVAGDVQQQAPLVLVIVDADPVPGGVVGTEDAPDAVHHANQVQRRVVCAGRGFAESETVNLRDAAEPDEAGAGVGGVIETVKRGQPKISLAAGSGVDTVLYDTRRIKGWRLGVY